MAKSDKNEQIDKEIIKKAKELYDLAVLYDKEIFICVEVNQLPLISFNYKNIQSFMHKIEKALEEVLK